MGMKRGVVGACNSMLLSLGYLGMGYMVTWRWCVTIAVALSVVVRLGGSHDASPLARSCAGNTERLPLALYHTYLPT